MLKKPILQSAISLFLSLILFVALLDLDVFNSLRMEKALQYRGYPRQVLSMLRDEVRESLYLTGGAFQHAALQYYKSQTRQTIYPEPGDGPQASFSGRELKGAHLELLWLVSQNPDHSIRVTLSYQWKKLPLNRWQDLLGVSWDKEQFYMKTDSFEKADCYTYRLFGFSGIQRAAHSMEQGFAGSCPDAVIWSADLKGYDIIHMARSLSGYASFTLVPYAPHGKSQLFAQYVHSKSPFSRSMYLADGSFTITGKGAYNHIGSHTEFSW